MSETFKRWDFTNAQCGNVHKKTVRLLGTRTGNRELPGLTN